MSLVDWVDQMYNSDICLMLCDTRNKTVGPELQENCDQSATNKYHICFWFQLGISTILYGIHNANVRMYILHKTSFTFRWSKLIQLIQIHILSNPRILARWLAIVTQRHRESSMAASSRNSLTISWQLPNPSWTEIFIY